MENSEGLKSKYDMFTDSWRLYKKYADVEDSDKYWETVISESRQLEKKYNNHGLMVDLLVAVINELERR